MKNLKNSLLKVFFGFWIWFLLLLLNTRNGEAELNMIKSLLDVVLVVMIVSSSIIQRYTAIVVALISTIATILSLRPWIELIIIITVVAVGMFIVMKLDDNEKVRRFIKKRDSSHIDESSLWRERNWLNPLFEKYTFDNEYGLNIKRGILKQEDIMISTINFTLIKTRTIWQICLGICDVYFLNKYTGEIYNEEYLKNIRNSSAEELKMLWV